VIVNYRTPALALGAVAAIAGERAALPGLRVIVVDGGSGDGSADALAAGLAEARFAGWTELIAAPINGGFGWANNQAIQRLLQDEAPPDYIHLLNPDTIAAPGAVATLAAALDAHPECAAVGSQLIEADGSQAGSAFCRPTIGNELFRGLRMDGLRARLGFAPGVTTGDVPCEVGWATGASVMLRAAALRQVGLFDTGFFLYFEETELMLRLARAGWTIRYEPRSRVEHVGGAATGVNGTIVVRERPALPRYWYQSRRRLFALTQGRAGGALASLAFLAGHLVFRARRLAGGVRHVVPTRDEARGLLRHGLVPDAIDLAPAATPWDEPPGAPPAWMAAR
jgi:N-acetylglucosaminyl-diphospho-decaprenol L-rhamnosyltransferase